MSRSRKGYRLLIWLLIVATAAVGLYYAYTACLRLVYPLKYEATVTAFAEQYDVPPSLIYAVIHTESHFREDAVSAAGAKGLMQLTEETYLWIQTKLPGEPQPIEEMSDPTHNIRCGTKLLSVLIEMFEVPETALAAYNAGSTHVKNWLRDSRYSADGKRLTAIPFEETDRYVQRVLETQKRYQTLYGIK